MEKHTFEITETFEVTFPHYRKYEFFYYKVLNDRFEIKVEYFPCTNTDKSIESAAIIYDRIVLGNTFRTGSYEITEEEFNETFQRAFNIIINHKN
jgi:hypothetical protein